jgi:hypothetical protein
VSGLSGNLEPAKPVLDTVITIEPKERTSYALLEEVCNKISIATNAHVIFRTVPENMLDNKKTSIRRIGKDGAIYFRTMESGERRPVVMEAIEFSRGFL